MSVKFNISWSFNGGTENHAETTSKTAADQLTTALRQAGARVSWSQVSVSRRGRHAPIPLTDDPRSGITPTQAETLRETLRDIRDLLGQQGEQEA